MSLDVYVTVEAKCKFCHCDLHLQVEESYHKLKDPMGLIRLASCNRCAELRSRRRGLHEQFVKCCASVLADKVIGKEAMEEAQKVFGSLLKRYLQLIEEWTGQQVEFDEGMADPFIIAPKNLGKHLSRLWNLTKQQTLEI